MCLPLFSLVTCCVAPPCIRQSMGLFVWMAVQIFAFGYAWLGILYWPLHDQFDHYWDNVGLAVLLGSASVLGMYIMLAVLGAWHRRVPPVPQSPA